MFFEEQREKLIDTLLIAGATIVVAAAIWFGLYFVYAQEEFKQRSLAESTLQKYSLKLDLAIEQLRVVTSSLAIFVEDHLEQPDRIKAEKELKEHIEKTLEEYPFLSGVQITKSGVVVQEIRIRSEVDSLRGNDLFLSEAFREDTIRSVNQLKSSFIGPKELIGGAMAVYVQVPVFDSNKEFHGVVQTAVRLDKLLMLANMDQLVSAGMPYELSKISEKPKGLWLFWADAKNILGKDLLTVPLQLKDARWELSVEAPIMKNRTTNLAIIFILALLCGVIAAILTKKCRLSLKQRQAVSDKQNDRTRNLTRMIEHYREIFDSADVGFIQWDKNQCLETWNIGFEKMYPKLVPFLEKGITRKQIYLLRAKFQEQEIITDWESTGTWYRNLDDGRIMMLKRTVMPDGGRLGMHVDMTAALGDQEYEKCLHLKTSEDQGVLVAKLNGIFVLVEAKKAFQSVLALWPGLQTEAVLFDLSRVDGDIQSVRDFCDGDYVVEARRKASPKIPPVFKVAFVLGSDKDPGRQEENTESDRLNIRAFYSRSDALAWLQTP